MDKDTGFIFRGVITENGGGFNSYCLDIDVSSHGSSIEEAKLNLLKQFEHEFKSSASLVSGADINSAKLSVLNNYIKDEFYFEHKISSFAGIAPENGINKSEIILKKEFDSEFIFINRP